jgi:hypothetical protein
MYYRAPAYKGHSRTFKIKEKLKSSTPEEIEKQREYKKLKAREYREQKNSIIN